MRHRRPASAKAGRPTDQRPDAAPIVTTLLDLMTAVGDAAASDNEAVAVVHHLMVSGHVRLLGQFTERDFGFAT